MDIEWQQILTRYIERLKEPTICDYDARGNLTTMVYDSFGRLVEKHFPEATNGAFSSLSDVEEFAYDANGRVIQRVTRDGWAIGFQYDALGRVTKKDLPGAAEDVLFGYDLLGRGISVRFAVAGSDIVASYDKAGRPVSVTSGGRTLAYQYDAASRRTRMTWPDGFFIAYDHDMLNRMIAVRENGAGSGVGVLATYAYDDLGRRSSILRGNGVATSYGYDAVSRLASLTHDLAGTSSDYAVGFAHSPASAITMRDQSNALYDWSAPATGAEAASHNDLDQVTTSAGAAITHDANGNLATWGSWSFVYDIENRLKQISGPTSMTLAYDPLGRLAGTVAGAATTQFLYDGSDLVAEYDGAGNVIRRYIHGPGIDEPLVWYEGSGTAARRWLHADERGSVIAASTATGNPFATWRYGPHGESADLAFSRFGYTGQMTIEGAPLQHFKARAYAPALGRFLQPDPIGQAGGLNLYGYAGNDPVNFSDPSGLMEDVVIDEIVVTARRIPDRGFRDYLGMVFFGSTPRPGDGAFAGGLPQIGGEGGLMPVVVKGEGDVCALPQPFPDINIRGSVAFAQSLNSMLDPDSLLNLQDLQNANSTAFIGVSIFAAFMAPHSVGDFKRRFNSSAFAEAGNFHFGLVGTIAGFSRTELLSGGGVVQMLFGVPGSEGTPLLREPFGELPEDVAQIDRGIAAAKAGCFQ